MALKIYDKFAPFANPADGDYPYGSIKNDTTIGAEDGTPLDATWGNDYVGFDAALFAAAGITPSGLADTALSSQRFQALQILINRQALGNGQTWQNVTGSRTVGVTYTNTTGRSIVASITSSGGDAGTQIIVDSLPVSTNDLPSGVITTGVTASAVVPPGSTYSYVTIGGTVERILELR